MAPSADPALDKVRNDLLVNDVLKLLEIEDYEKGRA
jgi:hypothetical protein